MSDSPFTRKALSPLPSYAKERWGTISKTAEAVFLPLSFNRLQMAVCRVISSHTAESQSASSRFLYPIATRCCPSLVVAGARRRALHGYRRRIAMLGKPIIAHTWSEILVVFSVTIGWLICANALVGACGVLIVAKSEIRVREFRPDSSCEICCCSLETTAGI